MSKSVERRLLATLGQKSAAVLFLIALSHISAVESAETPGSYKLNVDVPVVIDADGRVSAMTLPPDMAPIIAAQLRERILGWRFEPARRNGRAVSSRTHLTIDLRFEPLSDGSFAMHVVEVGNGPKALTRIGLRYPIAAIQSRIEGAVLVRMTVKPDGSVENVRADKPVSPSLARAALRAVRQWQFEPEQVDGMPVASEVAVPIRFCIGQDGDACSRPCRAEMPEREWLPDAQGPILFEEKMLSAVHVCAHRVSGHESRRPRR